MNMVEFQEQWRNRMNGILTDIFTTGGGGLMMDSHAPGVHMNHRQNNGHAPVHGIVYNQNHHAVYPHSQPQMTPQQVPGNNYTSPYYSWEYSSRCA